MVVARGIEAGGRTKGGIGLLPLLDEVLDAVAVPVVAAGGIATARAVAAVLAAGADRPAIRRRAVVALAAFTGPEVEAALEAASTDRDWQVRQAAEDLRGIPGDRC